MVNLEKLRLRALALRSSIHNEHQLSAIELCGMVAKKTNEMIDIINVICKTLDNLVVENGLVLTYDPEKEEINIGVSDDYE